ncbi:putative ABC transporter permease [Candidatus Merdisoma sp. HCP28S3_D10]|uniref:putative ABC transporter permease n=1 Tax=unclassified Candidatus Merdisoma TaxID=3099611 RepID=UPI003F8CDD0D
MWEIQIAGTDIYHIINWFYIYSFLGWLWESSYVSFKEKKLVNRGFVTGPVCTIYGFGAVIVYLILKPISGNIILLYLGGVIVPTILEYATAVLMETLFHTSWWDYSKNKYNFQGRICLGASLGWGAFSVILFYVFQPFVERIVALYSAATGELLVRIATLVYAVDFGMSYMNAMQIGEKLRNMDAVMDELYEYIQNSRLYESTEELKGRLAHYRLNEYVPELKHRLEERVNAMVAFAGETPDELRSRQENRRAELAERISAAQKRFERLKGMGNVFTRRTMNAYPNMKSRAQALKERAIRKVGKDSREQ